MEKEKLKISVRDVHTKQILFECPIEQPERAWAFAAEMEEMGLDVEIDAPTLSDSLSSSLGLTVSEHEELKQSIEAEMESHEGSCCFTDKEKLH
jgi:hypothetical protein